MKKPLQVMTIFAAVAIFAITLAPMTVSAYTVDPALITTVQGYAAEAHHGAEHVDRWNRVLAGLGAGEHDNPMTAQEAQGYAYEFNYNRWSPIVDAMASLHGVTVDKPAALISIVQDYATETHKGAEHVDRWNRVLAGLGAGEHDNPMTAQEAQEFADKGWKRWVPVAEALTVLELQPQAAPQTDQDGQPTQWEQFLNPQDAPQNSGQPQTRQERVAAAEQMVQEMKSIAAELRQDLDEATAFVNTLDNKARYTGSLAVARVNVAEVEGLIPTVERHLSSIRTGDHAYYFEELLFEYNYLHNRPYS